MMAERIYAGRYKPGDHAHYRYRKINHTVIVLDIDPNKVDRGCVPVEVIPENIRMDVPADSLYKAL